MAYPLHRKPRTAAQLLPLPPSIVKTLCLQQHCAVAAFRDGRGGLDQIPILARVVYLPFLMRRAEHGRKADPVPYRAAEAMLHRCLVRGQAGQGWRLDADEANHFAGLLAHYDAQLAACRSHAYADAVESLADAEAQKCSPLAERGAPPECSAFFVQLLRTFDPNGANGQAA